MTTPRPDVQPPRVRRPTLPGSHSLTSGGRTPRNVRASSDGRPGKHRRVLQPTDFHHRQQRSTCPSLVGLVSPTLLHKLANVTVAAKGSDSCPRIDLAIACPIDDCASPNRHLDNVQRMCDGRSSCHSTRSGRCFPWTTLNITGTTLCYRAPAFSCFYKILT
ncbi:hypothetical protein GQ53DRAFT_401302 [Thozetella sp. PMI_491]|nr:hypothetical protein GQ53DRAFT_401302 [Thozetella sp. PMI_491]